MTQREDFILNYDRVVSKNVGGERIDYGIIFGNEKIVFIKTGADGNIRGHCKKNLKVAGQIHKKMGATVICASNPYVAQGHIEADKEMIMKIIKKLNCHDHENFFFGTSDGAYHNLCLAKEFSKTVKIVCINTSSINFDDLKEKIFALPRVDKIFVYGDKDEEYHYVSQLEKLITDQLRIITIEGANHEFKRRLNDYIALTELL